MKRRSFNMIAAVVAFAAGVLFVFSSPADVTADVIGASGPGGGITALMGIILIVVASAFFVTIGHYHSNHPKLEDDILTYKGTKAKVEDSDATKYNSDEGKG